MRRPRSLLVHCVKEDISTDVYELNVVLRKMVYGEHEASHVSIQNVAFQNAVHS